MPFTVPTFQAILARIKADFRSVLGVDPQASTVEYALVRAEAAQSKGQYSYGAYIKAQSFPDTADEAHFWRWAAVWGVYQLPATCWSGTYRFTGTAGNPIPVGTELSRADGQLYVTSNATTIGTGGSVEVAIAGKPGYEGTANNCDPGQPLTLSTPLAWTDSEGVVVSTLIDGADLESQAQGLTRLLAVIQSNVPAGGVGDYVAWALEVPGVTRAWEYVIGPGAVAIAFVRDNDGPGVAILPDPAEAEQVRAHVQSKAPITVTVSIATLAPVMVNFTMSVLPNTADVKAAVNLELADFFLREATPGATLDISRMNAAISAAAGETSHVLTAPVANVVTAQSQMAILGTVTFT
jgi:uncharacterized phage protein gp47/JayE